MFFKKPPREWIHAHYTGDNGFKLKGKMHVAIFINCVYKLASTELRILIQEGIDEIDHEEADALQEHARAVFDKAESTKESTND